VVVEGQDVELKCLASGYPPPEIYWRRQDNDPLPKNADGVQSSIVKGNILSIRNVTKDNRGTYYCVATNVVGQGARRNVDVEVEFAPVLRLPRKRLGQALQFEFNVLSLYDHDRPSRIVGNDWGSTNYKWYLCSFFIRQ
jgi:hypothetical protein